MTPLATPCEFENAPVASRRALVVSACAAAASACAPLAATAATAAGQAVASPTVPAPSHGWLPQSRRIGQGTLRMLGFTVYDASLFALADFDATAFAAHPLVLEVRYRRSLSGTAIADYSLKEMRRGAAVDDGTAERWLQFMRRAFPDVQDGDRLTGQWVPETSTTRFAANDAPALTLQDAAFGPRFFGIWLSPQSPRPDMRERLLGLRSAG